MGSQPVPPPPPGAPPAQATQKTSEIIGNLRPAKVGGRDDWLQRLTGDSNSRLGLGRRR